MINEKPEAERAAYIEELRAQYREDVDLYKLAADLHVDAIVRGDDLRRDLSLRFAAARGMRTQTWPRKRAVTPV